MSEKPPYESSTSALRMREIAEGVVMPSSKYVPMDFPVSFGRLDMARKQRDQTVTLDVCNLCGAVVGNRPAHDVFCYSDAGPIAENYR